MLTRAYSQIELKSVDEEQRILEGIASTPVTDRQDDIVEPLGAKFSLPLPFLWQHDSRSPIGHVVDVKTTKSGIKVKVQLAKTDRPGPLKDLLDTAWESIRIGLVRGLSIGFKALEKADIEGTWGFRFTSWEWLELSAVTIAANQEASITSIKSADQAVLREREKQEPGASGSKQQEPSSRTTLPGASGASLKTNMPKRGTVKTTAEQIQDLQNARAQKAARMDEIQKTASAQSRLKTEDEREEFDTLASEIRGIDAEIKDAQDLELIMGSNSKPVSTEPKFEKAAESREPRIVTIERQEKLEPGIGFARIAMLSWASQGNPAMAMSLAKQHYPHMKSLQDIFGIQARTGQKMEKLLESHMALQKAAVPAATTTDSDWAQPLVAYNTFAGDFIEYLRPRTIVGQFGQGSVPGLRRIPFNVHIKGQTVGGTGYWVGEGKPKPVTAFGYNDTYHGWYKVAAIAVLTEEIVRFSDPSAERLVRESLADVLQERIDEDFIDPAITLTANVRPASITNGVTAIPSSGATADDVRTDLQALFSDAMAANLSLAGAVLVTTPAIALALSLMMNALGQREFPSMSLNGGTLEGIPVIVSNYVPTGLVVLVFAPEIYFSDDGQATLDVSREASIQMLDNPTNESGGATVATTLVSMFQTDSLALRAHRFINWSKRRTEAVAVLEDVAWGGASLS